MNRIADAPSLARYSLRWRLPLLTGGLLVLVIATLLAAAYREVRANLVQMAGTRAQATADQLASLLAVSTQQRLVEIRRAASSPPVRRWLENPSEDTREAAQTAFARLTSVGPQRIDVWSAAHQCLASWVSPVTAADVLPACAEPSDSGIAPLQRRDSVVFTESVTDIPRESSPEEGPQTVRAPRLGVVVVRRTISAQPTADLLNRLVGQGATIGLGNTTGDVWTDLAKPTDSPPVTLTRSGLAEYRGRDGQWHFGALADIRGTPWAVWVEFPSSVIVAPARTFLRRMLLIALGFVALAGVIIRTVAGRITTPLHQLVSGSEAIAAGDYGHRVDIHRRDEIGRLSTAFNAMAAQVESAHHGLEERVQQRTARLEEAQEELDRFFSLSLDLLCIADHGRFTRVNPAWETVLGWSSEDLTSAPFIDFVHPDDRLATAAEETRLATGAVTLSFENRYRHKNGSYRWLSWNAVSHTPRGVIYATARDITEEKRAARDLQQHAADLAAVNHELEAFSYSVSHDLRAPLRHIAGFAMKLEQAVSGALDQEGRRYLKTITDAANRMGQLIDDLLSFSRVGRVQFARSRVDLQQVALDVRQEVAADLNGRSVAWRIHDLPVVNADPAMLRVCSSTCCRTR